MIMFDANTTPANAASRRSRKARGAEPALFGQRQRAQDRSAYAQRHSAAAAGATRRAFATRIAVNAIVSAPSTPASAGRFAHRRKHAVAARRKPSRS